MWIDVPRKIGYDIATSTLAKPFALTSSASRARISGGYRDADLELCLDIRGGTMACCRGTSTRRCGLETILVLTGVTTREQGDRFPYRPTRILESVAEVEP